MDKEAKKRGRVKYKNLKTLRTKGAFLLKEEAFLIIFQSFILMVKIKKVDTNFNCLNKIS